MDLKLSKDMGIFSTLRLQFSNVLDGLDVGINFKVEWCVLDRILKFIRYDFFQKTDRLPHKGSQCPTIREKRMNRLEQCKLTSTMG